MLAVDISASPRPSQGPARSKLLIIILRSYFHFSHVGNFTCGTKELLVRFLIPQYTSWQGNLLYQGCTWYFSPPCTFTKNNNSQKTVPDKALKIMSVIKSCTLNTHLFNVFYDEMGRFCMLKYVCFEKKHLCDDLSCKLNQPFLSASSFLLEE